MKTFRLHLFLILFSGVASLAFGAKSSNPVYALVDRIDPGASSKFRFEVVDPQSAEDFFELSSAGNKVVVKGNNYISIATGLNWYLKYHAGIQVAWNNPHPSLQGPLPKVATPERRSTAMLTRYYFNYCTFSYTMAFWDWSRWQQEIDWMALHGVNMPLALTGTATVWKNTLARLGYAADEIDRFVAGPAHQAWFLMNNLEGWGGPNSQTWYDEQVELQQKIVARYREWGIDPVFPGYAGMVPHDAKAKLGLNVKDPGTWCGFQRPAFLLPTDPRFAEIAGIYYQEMEKLFGKAKYYSMDPFHEGGNTDGVDMKASGEAIFNAMRQASAGSSWVIQGWQDNPRPAMIRDLPAGGVIVLDLVAESRPQWGDPKSPWVRAEGHGRHDWVYCMLLNFGGNVGMAGKLQRVADGYYLAKEHKNGQFLRGVGVTAEAIENNPVMYELLFELPWRDQKPVIADWVNDWIKARYGHTTPQMQAAWDILSRTVYEYPYESTQAGVNESVFCGRPALRMPKVSGWGSAKLHYDPKETLEALGDMLEVADLYRGNNNFEYDLVDVARQATTDCGNLLLRRIEQSYDQKDTTAFRQRSELFLQLILAQDSLLSSRPEFMLGPWIDAAVRNARHIGERETFSWNAKTLITTWGPRIAANSGSLHDYSHREWSGVLGTLYYQRWSAFFEAMNAGVRPAIDYFAMEAAWAEAMEPYFITPQADPIARAKATYRLLQTIE